MMFTKCKVFTLLLIVAVTVTFRAPLARTLCTELSALQATDSCSIPVLSDTKQRKAQYEFSINTLKVMHKIAIKSQSPIEAEVAEILRRMQQDQTNGVGFYYDVHWQGDHRHNSDCRIYARTGRGNLDTSNVVHTIGGQECDNEATALLILYGRTIDRFSAQETIGTPKYFYSKHPNVKVALDCAATPYSEVLSIITYHQITREPLIAASSKINIDVIEMTTPTIDYTVRRGDSMYTIAQQATGVGDNWKTIWALNPQIANPALLMEGLTINIPPNVINWKTIDGQSTDHAVDAMKIYGNPKLAEWGQSLDASFCGVSVNMRDRLVPIFSENQPYKLNSLWFPKLKSSR